MREICEIRGKVGKREAEDEREICGFVEKLSDDLFIRFLFCTISLFDKLPTVFIRCLHRFVYLFTEIPAFLRIKLASHDAFLSCATF